VYFLVLVFRWGDGLWGAGLRDFDGGFDRRERWKLYGVKVLVFLMGGF
jgi:hypothetical protein